MGKTFVGGKDKNRHLDKKVEKSQGRCFKDKTPVLGMIERQGKLIARVLENTEAETLTPEIIRTVKNTASVITDEWVGYNSLKRF